MRRLSLFALLFVVAGLILGSAGAAWADPYTGPAGQTPKLTPAGFTSPSSNHAFTDTNGAQVLGETFTRTANGGFLARTGADILGTAAVGVFCLGLGVVLVRRSRRHGNAPATPAV